MRVVCHKPHSDLMSRIKDFNGEQIQYCIFITQNVTDTSHAPEK